MGGQSAVFQTGRGQAARTGRMNSSLIGSVDDRENHMNFSRRNVLKMSAVAAGILIAPRAWAQGDEGPVNWLSWGVYDVPEVIESFQQSSKLKVNVINFEDNSTGFLKVKQDRSDRKSTRLNSSTNAHLVCRL